ncbi:MAG: esterase [Oxalobacteraceae bacterium]|nr:esterase [Oxalobacteraceae bacterium]
MILYLHGFRSSPQSAKARRVSDAMHARGQASQLLCPQLPPSPREAMQLAHKLVSDVPAALLTVIGSSLGGYYATALAEATGCRAVLLNPAVRPARALASHVGLQTAWHSEEPFEFLPEYIDELASMVVARITQPERYFLIAAKGDEVLDWREMVAHYPGARQRVIDGSDHGLSDFDQYLDDVLAFCA